MKIARCFWIIKYKCENTTYFWLWAMCTRPGPQPRLMLCTGTSLNLPTWGRLSSRLASRLRHCRWGPAGETFPLSIVSLGSLRGGCRSWTTWRPAWARLPRRRATRCPFQTRLRSPATSACESEAPQSLLLEPHASASDHHFAWIPEKRIYIFLNWNTLTYIVVSARTGGKAGFTPLLLALVFLSYRVNPEPRRTFTRTGPFLAQCLMC